MKTVLNVKTDKEVKEQAQKIAKEMGIPLSVVVNSQLKNFIRERKFTASIEPQFKDEVWAQIRKAIRDVKNGKNISGPFSTSEKMNDYLDSL